MIRTVLLLMVILLAACKEPIIHNLSEAQANNVLSGLTKINISAVKSKQADGDWIVSVSKSEVISAIRYLNESRLIRSSRPTPEKESSLVASREDQRFHYERSLSREIEYTLTSVEGVLDARVHLNLPARDPLFGQKVDQTDSGSASILLVTDNNLGLKEPAIASLVAGASGISAEHISVLMSVEPLNVVSHLVANPENSFSIVKNWKTQLVISLFLLGAFGLWVTSKYSQQNKKKLDQIKQQIVSQDLS